MILNILKELLEKDVNSITSDIKIQNVYFHVGVHTPVSKYEVEKCL